MGGLRVAIVHEKFTINAGSERVVDQLHLLWPDAPIFCGVCDPATLSSIIADADIRPHPLLQTLYRGGDHYAHLLPLLPFAASQRSLKGYDVVVTSHHQFANRVHSNAPIVSYTHSPARWIWNPAMRNDEMGGRIGRAGLGVFARTQRRADRKAAQRLHAIAANSTEVATRVRDWWHRDSTVIAPPVDTDFFTAFDSRAERNNRDDFFLLAGRLVPYKHPEIAVAAAQRAGVRLVVAGDGRARAACEAYAGKHTEFVGAVSDEQLRDYYRRCRALIYPGREDFGIMPVEAQSCGAPVIAVGVGGVLDTVVDDTTGILYPEGPNEVAVLAEVLRDFDGNRFDPVVISDHAARFHPSHFQHAFRAFVEQSL